MARILTDRPGPTPFTPPADASSGVPRDLSSAAVEAGRVLYDTAGVALSMARRLPLFRPTFDRHIPHRLAQDVVRSRLLPLLEHVAREKLARRKSRAEGLPEQLDDLLERAHAISADTRDADSLFSSVTDLTQRLERFLSDVDYVSFGQIGLVGQLRSLSTMLRTSRALWTSVRTGYAFKDPELRRQGLRVMARADALFTRAAQGQDITRELDRLEAQYTKLLRGLEDATSQPLGLPDVHHFDTARRVWSYRQRAEAEILERDGRTGALTNQELYEDLRTNGLPPRLLREEIDAHVLPALRGLISEVESQRGMLPDRIRRRAHKIEQLLTTMLLAPKIDIDIAEERVIEAQEELSKLLADVERLVKPADGLARKLRTANDALIGLRGLFVSIRLVQAMQDPLLAKELGDIADDANALLSGKVSVSALPEALDALDGRIDRLDASLQDRLRIEQTPGLTEIRNALDTTRRVVRVRLAADAAMNPAMRAAVDAAQDITMSADVRGPIFDAAMGQPLLDATVGMTVAMRELELGFTFAEVGAGLERMLRGESDGEVSALVAKSPLAFLANAEFEKALGRFDTFVDRVDTPEGRAFVDRSLDIFRAVYEVEKDQIAHFAAVVPPSERVRVAAGITEYMVRASTILLEWISVQLADPTGEAVADFLDLMVDESAKDIDTMHATVDPEAFGKNDVISVRARMNDKARLEAKRAGVRQLGSLGTRLSEGPGGPYAARLRAERTRLEKTLECVQTTDNARAALHDVLSDVNAAVKMSVNLVQVFGAASNDLMDEEERRRVIKTSVERMGPTFIKAMQSLVNMEALIRKMSPDALPPEGDPVIEALKQLQDEVTPLPWPQIEERIRTSFGLSADDPLVDAHGVRGKFVSIEKTALKSGSIGQIHRARIRVQDEDGERIENVVVKVLRPGVEEQFENTIRATRLTLSVVSELLRLDKNGEIFGDIKASAEARLPLIEKGLYGFIESFRIETDFPNEKKNLALFEKLFRADPNVVVPEVYDSHTEGSVLTMQELNGFKLSAWTDRYAFAKDRPALAEELGRVAPGDEPGRAARWAKETLGLDAVAVHPVKARRSWAAFAVEGRDPTGRLVREEVRVHKKNGRISVAGYATPCAEAAEAKAKQFAERRFGLAVNGTESLPANGGYRVRVTFDDNRQKSAELFVSRTGEVTSKERLPDLSARGAEALRDRLRQTFMVQIIKGLLHGDPHEGNFFVMPDGETIGLIDFGLALDLGILDARGPLSLIASAYTGDTHSMADALIDLSTGRDLEGDARDEARRPLEDFFRDLSADVAQNDATPRKGWLGGMKARFGRAMTVAKRSIEAVMQHGVVPLPRVVHALKAIFSMTGNIERLDPFDDRKPSKTRTLGLLAKSWLTSALAPFTPRSRSAAKHRRLAEEAPPLDVPRFVIAPKGSPPEAQRRAV